MKKSLIVGTILLTASLLVGGIWFPNIPLMWLAGTSLDFTIVRIASIAILAVLLFSNPPRALYVRYIIGASGVLLAALTVGFLLTFHINLVDAIVFGEIATILGIEALELPENYPTSVPKRKSRLVAE